jgi:hypothetical protein
MRRRSPSLTARAGTGFIGITSKRPLFYDKAFLRNGRYCCIPYRMVNAVASVDQGRGVFGTTSSLVVGNECEFEFRRCWAQQAYELIMREMPQSEPA